MATSPASRTRDGGDEPQIEWVTRCTCGNNKNQQGLMIQCEQCDVWQHGSCVGVLKNQVPEHYECEQCNPEAYNQRMILKKERDEKEAKGKKRRAGRGRPPSDGKKKPRYGSIDGDEQLAGDDLDEDLGDEEDDGDLQHDDGYDGNSLLDTPPDKKLSREQRKMLNILRSIELLENRGKKTTEPTKRKSRPTSQSKPATSSSTTNKKTPSVPRVSSSRKNLNVDVMRESLEEITNLFPMSPMYLGKQVWLTQVHASKQYAKKSKSAKTESDPNLIEHSFKKLMLENYSKDNIKWFYDGRYRKRGAQSSSRKSSRKDSMDLDD